MQSRIGRWLMRDELETTWKEGIVTLVRWYRTSLWTGYGCDFDEFRGKYDWKFLVQVNNYHPFNVHNSEYRPCDSSRKQCYIVLIKTVSGYDRICFRTRWLTADMCCYRLSDSTAFINMMLMFTGYSTGWRHPHSNSPHWIIWLLFKQKAFYHND